MCRTCYYCSTGGKFQPVWTTRSYSSCLFLCTLDQALSVVRRWLGDGNCCISHPMKPKHSYPKDGCGCIMETNLRELSDKLTNHPKYTQGYIDLQQLDNSLVHALILVKSTAHSPWCVVHKCQLPKASLIVVVEYLHEGGMGWKHLNWPKESTHS